MSDWKRLAVSGRCTTNLDAFQRCDWPTEFVAVPRIGERVEAISGDRTSLRVVGVTHCIDRDGLPFIRVELHR